MKKSQHRHRDRRRLKKAKWAGITTQARGYLLRIFDPDWLPVPAMLRPGTAAHLTANSAWMWTADGSFLRVE